jgi:hypothetical protein
VVVAACAPVESRRRTVPTAGNGSIDVAAAPFWRCAVPWIFAAFGVTTTLMVTVGSVLSSTTPIATCVSDTAWSGAVTLML